MAAAAQKSTKQRESLAEPPLVIRDPPPAFLFSADPPTLSALDLDVVKLTAQFVAVHGHAFLSNLMSNERKNPLFDFTRPQHGLFSYFTHLTRQYADILVPADDNIATELRNEVQRDKNILDKMRYRLEWTKNQEAEKRREEEEAERERVQYAQIDWHDFVIVETVDYQPNEQGQFPPPTTPEQVGSRILQQQRTEEQGAETIEMEVDSDDEESGKEPEKAEKEVMPPPPLPPSLDNVLIKKDYNPKAARNAAPSQTTPKADAWVVSPLTGEKIAADKIQEHMRYALLDPRWVEEHERTINEKMQQEEVFAPGVAIESSLKHLAERRTDIFGSGTEETAIGRKIGEEEKRANDKVIWDGYSSSAQQAVSAAQSKITIEEQIQDIRKRVYPDPAKDKIGPAVIPQQQPPIHRQTAIASHSAPAPGFLMPSPMSGMFGMQHHLHPPAVAPPHLMHLQPPFTQSLPPGVFPEDEAQAAKKLKTEDSLIPEQEFLKQSPASVTIRVAVPHVTEKSEWNLTGQSLSLTLSVTETLSSVKTKIHESVGMPPGKQKLQYEGMFVKDTNSLAFYNMGHGSVIHLHLKERGGRKK